MIDFSVDVETATVWLPVLVCEVLLFSSRTDMLAVTYPWLFA